MTYSGLPYWLISLCCVCMLCAGHTHAQSFLFSKLTASHGLSDNNARALVIDNNGFLWIGTSQGLNKYDGYNVNTYLKEHNPDLASDMILDVKCDKLNRIWIGTPEGASWLDQRRIFRRVILGDSIKQFHCFSTFETAIYGNIINTNRGQFYYDSTLNKWRELSWIPAPVRRPFMDSERFNDDRIIFCVDSLVAILDYRQQNLVFQRRFEHPVSACRLNETQIVVGLQTGKVIIVDIITGREIKTFELKHNLNGKLINTNLSEVRRASNGDILVATDFNGLVVIDQNGKITEHTHDPLDAHSLSSNYTYRVLSGNKGEVIVGTYTSGANMGNILNKSAGFTRVFKDKDGNLFDNFLTDIAAGGNEVYWIGALDRLIKWNRTTNESKFFTYYAKTEGGIRPIEIRTISPQPGGKLFIGTMGQGPLIFDPRREKFTKLPRDTSISRAVKSNFVYEISKSRKGFTWVGSDGGLYSVDPVTLQITSYATHPVLKTLENKKVLRLYESADNKLWIGTGANGLYVYDYTINSLINYTTINGLPSNTVNAIAGDKTGRIFVSTQTGFTVISADNQMRHYTYNNGLRYYNCQDLMTDNTSGTVWIANTKCLIKFSPGDGSMQYFEENAGLSIEGFRVGSSTKTADGEFFWGSRSGVNYFYPNELISIPSQLTLSIYNVLANGRTNMITSDYSSELPYMSNDISIQFSAINLYGSRNVYYQYKLDGYEKDWHTAIDIREAHYTSLPTGQFTFQVRASLDGINWVNSNNSVHLRIIPPLWQRWWFIVGSIFLLIGSLYWLFANRNRKIREQKEALETEQAINYFATHMYADQTVDAILWEVARNCIARLGFEDCVIYLLDEERSVLVQKAAHGPKSPALNQIENLIEIPVGKGIVGSVAATGTAEIIGDTTKEPRYIVDDAFRYSEIAVPIISDGKVLGVIDCEHSKKQFFTQKHLSILNTIASLCANKIVRTRAEEEKERAQAILMDTQQKMAEIEMQALRAQMNPHFIFNCLNSINRYIVKSDQATASLYLTRFAKLIRLILDNSNNKNVILSNELEALRLYIEMEALRFDKKFTYGITVHESVNTDSIEVPPLIIQPYVENAIWHGLLHKEEEGHLAITVTMLSENMIQCVIEDNGIGRDKARELKSKSAITRKSLGMKLTENRLSLLNKYAELTASVDIIDLTGKEASSEGTRVILTIPVL
ncbi:MAG: GAF domain-containing protein [Chitinophagaceae bacterium]|nr:MAG: GAF domain-containing protein [Chitinophagaceae bacterium]